MKKYLDVLKTNMLFMGIKEEDLINMLDCLSADSKKFAKNEYIYMTGDSVSRVGIIAEGGAYIVNEDIAGNRNIIAHVVEGELFGEAFAFAETELLPVSIVASSDCCVIFIDYKKIIMTCNNSCTFHQRLLENMLKLLAEKNILLNDKIRHISKRTIREKVLSYLLRQSQLNKKNYFKIPFNRQELADYLCADRSALSSELCKLRDEGIIEFNKNEFKLNKF